MNNGINIKKLDNGKYICEIPLLGMVGDNCPQIADKDRIVKVTTTCLRAMFLILKSVNASFEEEFEKLVVENIEESLKEIE